MITSNTPGIGRDMAFLLIFGVFPAFGLLIGGAYIGGWVLGEASLAAGTLAILAGTFGASGWIWLTTNMVAAENDRKARERTAELMKRLDLK